MEMTSEQIDGATIIHLSGRFDAYAAPTVEVFFQKIFVMLFPVELLIW